MRLGPYVSPGCDHEKGQEEDVNERPGVPAWAGLGPLLTDHLWASFHRRLHGYFLLNRPRRGEWYYHLILLKKIEPCTEWKWSCNGKVAWGCHSALGTLPFRMLGVLPGLRAKRVKTHLSNLATWRRWAESYPNPMSAAG